MSRFFKATGAGFTGILAAALASGVALTTLFAPSAVETAPEVSDHLNPDPKRAYGYLNRVCRIGSRVSGSRGMAQQQQLIVAHFSRFGAEISYQSFDAAHPLNGTPVRMNNILVSWHPRSKERVLLACHYDTRPFPDRDRSNPRGVFLGANDGASGVALFMEMAHHMRKLKPTYGVDFLFVDGEELVFKDGDDYFLGSTYFATQYRDKPPGHRYVAGVVADMVADKRLALYMEKNSLKFAPDVTRSVWATAKKLRVREFVGRAKHEVLDDHLPLNEIAGIPTCDIIDFDYPQWHTTKDQPSACSGASLAKVGKVLLYWLQEVPRPKPSASK